jgi:hypothetical protein
MLDGGSLLAIAAGRWEAFLAALPARSESGGIEPDALADSLAAVRSASGW